MAEVGASVVDIEGESRGVVDDEDCFRAFVCLPRPFLMLLVGVVMAGVTVTDPALLGGPPTLDVVDPTPFAGRAQGRRMLNCNALK